MYPEVRVANESESCVDVFAHKNKMIRLSLWCFYIYVVAEVYLFAGGLANVSTESRKKYDLVQNAKLLGFQLSEPIPANLNKTYNGSVTDGRNVIYSFNFTKTDDKVNIYKDVLSFKC